MKSIMMDEIISVCSVYYYEFEIDEVVYIDEDNDYVCSQCVLQAKRKEREAC